MLFVFACGFKHPCLALQHSVLISSGTDYLLARLVKSVHKLEAHKVLSKGLKNTSEVTNEWCRSFSRQQFYLLPGVSITYH